MLDDQTFDTGQLVGLEPYRLGEAHRLEPKLRQPIALMDLHVRRLTLLIAVKEEAKRSILSNRRSHQPSLSAMSRGADRGRPRHALDGRVPHIPRFRSCSGFTWPVVARTEAVSKIDLLRHRLDGRAEAVLRELERKTLGDPPADGASAFAQGCCVGGRRGMPLRGPCLAC